MRLDLKCLVATVVVAWIMLIIGVYSNINMGGTDIMEQQTHEHELEMQIGKLKTVVGRRDGEIALLEAKAVKQADALAAAASLREADALVKAAVVVREPLPDGEFANWQQHNKQQRGRADPQPPTAPLPPRPAAYLATAEGEGEAELAVRRDGALKRHLQEKQVKAAKTAEIRAARKQILAAAVADTVLKNTLGVAPLDPDEIKVDFPPFWVPPEGTALDAVGSRVNGEPTIFISIASYRDDLCAVTIAGAYSRANKPERINFGVIEQNADGDLGCVPDACLSETEWAALNEQERAALVVEKRGVNATVCAHRNQIRLFKHPARDSVGPVFARHIGNRLYSGEYFVLQVDAHITFVNGWDDKIIAQWQATNNERAVLSTYPKDTKGCCNAAGDSIVNTSPAMCNFAYYGTPSIIRHNAAGDVDVAKLTSGVSASRQPRGNSGKQETPSPLLHPFWAAGMSFARGHFSMRVPNDPHMTMMFIGEEINIAVRGWTSGYDFYAPSACVLFHPYGRTGAAKPKLFWENARRHEGAAARASMRLRTIMQCDKTPLAGTRLVELDLYGLGTERPVEWYYYLFGIDCVHEKRTKDICPAVYSAQMHKENTKYLRQNRLGIDYSQLPAIQKQFGV